MTTNRRLWLKQTGLALAGVSLWQTRLPAAPLRVPQPPPSGGPIRLSSNENPYGPSPLARQAMANAITASNRYPWEQTPELLKKIAALYGLQADHVLLGAGSSEILGLVAHLASIQKGHAISADPTFRSWWNVAEQCGLSIVKVPLTTDKKHDLAVMLSTLKNDTRLVYVCNPNNPTGTVVDSKELGDFIAEASKKCWVLLDEAYTEYSNEPSLANRVTYHKNLIVVKTFSKIYGLAGARIGYAIAHPDTIAQLGKLQPWPNAGVGAVSLAAAIASLGDHAFVADSKRQNSVAKAFTYDTFQQLAVRYIPSHTNYVYYSVEGFKGDWRNALKEKNILANGIVEPTGQWSRITIGTQEEMQQFSTVIKNIWT